MLSQASKFTLPSVAQTVNADSGRVAVAAESSFSEIVQPSDGSTVRKNPVLGEFRVSQSTTKDFGPGSIRTLLRLNLNSNGELPGASAYVVITTAAGAPGVSRGIEAFGLLISALFTMGQLEGTNISGMLNTEVLDSVARLVAR